MRLRSSLVILAMALAGLLPATPLGGPVRAASLGEEIEGAIICQCGCTYTLAACASAMGCSLGEQMRQTIAAQIGQGKSKEEIIGYFVSLYGETVLAAPTKRGFNLTAWITPFLAVVAGGGVVYAVLATWSHKSPVAAQAASRRRLELEEYAHRVDEELEREFQDS